MPGITTAAVGGTARLLWSATRGLGISDDKFDFDDSRRGLFMAQTLMALVNALLIVGLWWVLLRWINRRAATVAAVILATEPFLLVHGARLTTDSSVGAAPCWIVRPLSVTALPALIWNTRVALLPSIASCQYVRPPCAATLQPSLPPGPSM